MSVHPRETKTKGITWVVRLRDPSGRPIEKTFRLKRDAYAHQAKIRNDIAQQTYRDPSFDRMTVATWHQRWWPIYIAGDRSPGTIKTSESLIRLHLLPDLGDRTMSSVRRIHVDEWLTRKQAQGLSGSTRAKLKSLLGQMFAAAHDSDIVSRNPVAGVRLKDTAQRTEREALTPQQVDRLVASLPKAYQPLALLLAYTGLRPGEAIGLRRRHVIDGRVLLVEGALVESHGQLRESGTKTKRKRTVPLTGTIAEVLAAHLAARPGEPETRIFVTDSGCDIRLSNFRRVLRQAAEEAGLPPILPYTFRHTCASLLAQSSVPVSAAAQWMGHQPKVFLNTYAHLYDGDLAAAAAALDDNVTRQRSPHLKAV